jgi:hypothetical protein
MGAGFAAYSSRRTVRLACDCQPWLYPPPVRDPPDRLYVAGSPAGFSSRELTMSKRNHLLLVTHAAAVAVMMYSNAAAGAAECLAEPNSTPAEGERWAYRTDRQTNKKCWHLRREAETTGSAAPQQQKAAVESTTQSKAPSLTDSQKDELFMEFLKWRNRRAMQ